MIIANSVIERNSLPALAWRLNANDVWEGAETVAEKVAMFPTVESPEIVAVSAWQIRKALNAIGLRVAVENAIKSSGNQNLIDGWEYAGEFVSSDPLVIQMGAALGKSDADMLNIFKLAASL